VLTGRNLEDSVTWVDSSKIKRNIMKYSDKVSSSMDALMISLMILICYNDRRVNWNTGGISGMYSVSTGTSQI
jgi:hypothetical protein